STLLVIRRRRLDFASLDGNGTAVLRDGPRERETAFRARRRNRNWPDADGDFPLRCSTWNGSVGSAEGGPASPRLRGPTRRRSSAIFPVSHVALDPRGDSSLASRGDAEYKRRPAPGRSVAV